MNHEDEKTTAAGQYCLVGNRGLQIVTSIQKHPAWVECEE